MLLGAADAVVIADQQQGVKVVECDRQQQAAANSVTGTTASCSS